MKLRLFRAGPASVLHSVFVRCAALMALSTVVVAGAMAYQSSNLVERLARQGIVDQVAKSVPQQAEALKDALRFKAMAKIGEIVDQSLEAAGAAGQGAIVLDATGAVVLTRGQDGPGAEALADLALRSLADDVPVSDAAGLWLAAPIRAAADGPAIGVLAMAWSDEAALAQVAPAERRILAWALGLFLVMQLVTMLQLRRFLGRPLTRLGDAVQRVAQGDYDTPTGLDTRRDEIGGIARRIGELTDALQTARSAEDRRAEQHAAQARVVDHLGDALDSLAEGTLSHVIDQPFPEEYEALRLNYNRAADSLASAIREVRENAASINGGANEIAQASDDLSRRTETQAATLEQTAAALEQIVNSVRAAAENAGDADKTVRAARTVAAQNGSVMKSAVSAMAEIEKSSEQISDIITVIDDIAFQTNLLALNAGVEAARAGSSGKGFAVVASEVRALAQRSSEAARQIKDLIVGSADQVKHGVRLVERAGVALDEVVEQVGEISELVTGIAEASKEQAQGLNEINAGVGNLDQVTQQNAAMVEESTAAAHMLRQEAQNLSTLVARFAVDQAEANFPAHGPADAAPVPRVA